MNCTLCHDILLDKIDAQYYDCGTCRGLVKDPNFRPDPEQERLHYLAHNNDINDPRYQQFTAPITSYILKNFKHRDQGLDFGSGTGPVISKVLQDASYSVAQYDPYFADFPELLKNQYDYIVASEVVEHFYTPFKEFGMLFNMLKEKGSLVLMTLLYDDSVPFKTWYYRLDPTHVFIYRRETFEYLAGLFGFTSCTINERLVVLTK